MAMERHFDEELKELREKLLRMAALTESAVARSVKSLVRRDTEMAHLVILADDEINMMEIEAEELCLKLLALRQPIAKDLRFIAAAMKIINELERIGDLSVNIAQRTLDILKEPLLKPLIDIPRMAGLAQKMVTDSLEAFVHEDSVLARSVCLRDDEVDSLNYQIFRELLSYMLEDPQTVTRAVTSS
jgi:phosphate transport system protein